MVQQLRRLLGLISIRVLVLLFLFVFLGSIAFSVAQLTKSVPIPLPMVSTWGDLVRSYLAFRESEYALVVPYGFEDEPDLQVDVEQLQANPDWYWIFNAGVFYFDEKSQIGRQIRRQAHLVIYEDMINSELLVLQTSPNDESTFQEIMVYRAPSWPKSSSLGCELLKRRIVWRLTLKSKSLAEEEAAELEAAQEKALPAVSSEAEGMLLMMGMGDETNHLWVSLRGPAQGLSYMEVAAHIPNGFTNRIEVFACTNLLDSWWALAATNLSTEGTNTVYWVHEEPEALEQLYYTVGNADIDSDADGLADARERFMYHTDPTNPDTDGDDAYDGDEIEAQTDPLNNPGDFDQDGLSDDLEVVLGTDLDEPDTDGDWLSDGYEVGEGTDPLDVADAPPLSLVVNNDAFYARSRTLVLDVPGAVVDGIYLGETLEATNMVYTSSTHSVFFEVGSTGDGTKRVFARLARQGSELGPPFSGSIVLDTTPPFLGNFVPSNGAVTSRAWVKLEGAVSDETSPAHVLVDGMWADGIVGEQFQYDRYMLEDGSNVVQLVAQDAAGNATTQMVLIVQDTLGDSTGPTVALDFPQDYEIAGDVTNWFERTTYGCDEELYVHGYVDDDSAAVSISVVAGDQTSGLFGAVVSGTQVWGVIKLHPGTNLALAVASDAAGNATTNTYTLIRDTNFYLRITDPAPYQLVNAPSIIVVGEASAIFSGAVITVNGIATEITPQSTGIAFRTDAPVPLSWAMNSLVVTAEVDGKSFYADPPPYGYQVLENVYGEQSWESAYIVGCLNDCRSVLDQGWSGRYYSRWVASTRTKECAEQGIGGETYGSCNVPTYFTDWGSETSSVEYLTEQPMDCGFGMEAYRADGYSCGESIWWDAGAVWTGQLRFVKRWPTQETQTVIFQFRDLQCSEGWGSWETEPSLITYRGQTGFWYNGNVSFIVPLRTETEYSITEADFKWPPNVYFWDVDYWAPIRTVTHALWFSSFTNDILKVDTIEASSPVANNTPQSFEGHKTDFGDPCNSDDPGQALIVFYEDVIDGNYQVQDFDIDLSATILPSSIPHEQLSEVWRKSAEPSSGNFDRTDTSAVKYQNPTKGGIYQFEFDLGLNREPSGANALLPLAGATIDAWLEGEVSAMGDRASSWQNEVYLNSPIVSIEIYKHKVFAMISAYDFDYVGQSRNAQGTCPCEKYSHGDAQFDDPAYVTISGVVVHRSKINNLLWAVFGRHLGYPESWLKTGAFYNQAFQQNQNVDVFDNIHLFIDPPSSQKAIGLGSKLYNNNSVAAEIPAAKARDLQVGGTLFDKKLWPCTDALNAGNSTLEGPYDSLPTEYIE